MGEVVLRILNIFYKLKPLQQVMTIKVKAVECLVKFSKNDAGTSQVSSHSVRYHLLDMNSSCLCHSFCVEEYRMLV